MNIHMSAFGHSVGNKTPSIKILTTSIVFFLDIAIVYRATPPTLDDDVSVNLTMPIDGI